jgi:predicted solute-binding protein
MSPGVNDYTEYDAVLLIGDEALRSRKFGLAGFELIYDLATEWYEWKKIPFVFAVWAVQKSISKERKNELSRIIQNSLEHSEEDFSRVGRMYANLVKLTLEESIEYLQGFNFRLGERERAAIDEFQKLLIEAKQTERV